MAGASQLYLYSSKPPAPQPAPTEPTDSHCIAVYVYRSVAPPAPQPAPTEPTDSHCIAVYVYRAKPPAAPQPAPTEPVDRDCGGADGLCFTCVDVAPNTVLLACGHRGLCSACAARLWHIDRRCPLCRAGLSGVVLISQAC